MYRILFRYNEDQHNALCQLHSRYNLSHNMLLKGEISLMIAGLALFLFLYISKNHILRLILLHFFIIVVYRPSVCNIPFVRMVPSILHRLCIVLMFQVSFCVHIFFLIFLDFKWYLCSILLQFVFVSSDPLVDNVDYIIVIYEENWSL
jgi:hypothetical protein